MVNYPSCYNCKNVKLKMPFGDLKCMKDGNHKVIYAEDGDGKLKEVGCVIGSKGKLMACQDYKLRKGDIECETDAVEEGEYNVE